MEESLNNMKQKYQYVGFLPNSVRIKEKGFWGFNDFEGNQILPSNFIEVFTLSSGQGLIAARDAGYWDIYDFNGNKINDERYDFIYPYYGLFGMTKVKIGEYWGLINRFGKLVSQVKYKKIEKFGKGLLLYNSDKDLEFIEKSDLMNLKQTVETKIIEGNRKPVPKNVFMFPNRKSKTL
ncbi:MAG: WG repeat-containing protein [Melioribacteraceae bacterium]|nr:WG repeat-containing protein [Melioribacteraceae bacterium]